MAKRKNSFSKKKAIKFGWDTTIKNLPFLAGVVLVMGLIQYAPNFLAPYLRDHDALNNIVNIASYIASLGVTLGSVKIFLELADNKIPQFSDLFSLFDVKMIWRYFAASTLYLVVVVLGLLLLVIPGIYVATKYMFFTFFIVDEGVGVFESFSKSGEITKNRIWDLFLFDLLLVLIWIAGVLAFLVGLLVAMPVVSLATAYVYRKLYPPSKK